MIVGALLVLMSATVPSRDSRTLDFPNTDTHFAPPAFTSLEAWEKRKAKLRRQILTAAGLDPMPERTPLHAQVFGRIQTKDCTIDKVLIETMPGYYLGGNLYRPLTYNGNQPAVLNPHGHWTYGRLENQPLYSGPQFGSNLAKQGYVVFAWDMVGYNDTIQTPHAFGSPAEQLWSFGPLALQSWNALRALDFVSSLNYVDPKRIAMAGASGGATQTLLLAAMLGPDDNRISAFAPVNMVSSFMQGGDLCENAPGLRIGTSNVEIAAMIAPKPLLLVSATGDWTRNTPREEYPAIRRIYELYGKPENVETIQLDAPHNFNKPNREAVYRFFGKHILQVPEASKFAEVNTEVPQLQNMLALFGRTPPPNALTYERIFEQWKKRPAFDRRRALENVLGVEWPDAGKGEVINDATALSRPAAEDRVEYRFVEGKGNPALVIGAGDAGISSLRPVMSIQTMPDRDHSSKHFLAFNPSDDACRVQDILTALAWLHQKHPGPIQLIATGTKAAVLARFAAALAPIPINLTADLTAFHGTDEDFLKYLNVPGIQLAGGLNALQ